MLKYFKILFFLLIGLLVNGQDKDTAYQVKTVVIDAGHGGKDPGCHGSFAQEKEVCLKIALKLGGYIEENFKDVKVIYTRKTDVFLELHERANIANEHNADLFISIHANAASPAAHGTETYVMGLKYKDLNNDRIPHENKVIYLEEDYEKNYELNHNSPKAVIMRSIIQQEYLKNSIDFAEKIEYQFKHRVGRHSRGVRQKVLFVMYRTSCPSVLIETGFLTNKNEESFLTSENGQTYLASAIYRAFREYKLETEGYSKEQIQAFIEAQQNGVTIEEKKKEMAAPKEERSVQEEKTEESVTKNNQTSTKAENVFFSIQVVSSSDQIEINDGAFNGLKDVFEYQQGGWYKYAFGKFLTFEEAVEAQTKVREKGYETAFVIAFENDKRIALETAKEKFKSE